MTTSQNLCKAFKAKPPKGSKEMSYRLRAIWDSMTRWQRTRLRAAHGSYWYFPDLPEMNATICSVAETLTNAEKRGFEIDALFQAIDEGLRWGLAKRMLLNAKKDFRADPETPFTEHLDKNIADLARARKRTRGTTPVQAPVPRPVDPTPNPPDPANDMPSNATNPLYPSRRPSTSAQPQLEASIARMYATLHCERNGLNVDDYVNNLIMRDVERNGTKAYVDNFFPADGAPTRAPAAQGTEPPPRPGLAKTRGRRPSRSAKAKSPARKTKRRTHLLTDRETGERLEPFAKRLAIVMGSRAVSIAVAIKRLKAHNQNWVPISDDLPAYVSATLSSNPDMFEHVERGKYRVRSVQVPLEAAAAE